MVSVVFYEPQSDVDVTYGAIADELDNPDSIEILRLADAMPRSMPPRGENLEELAKLAFPVTKEEKSKAARRPWKVAASKKAAKMAVPKKAAKMAAPKKAAKMVAPKKAAKMAAKKK